VNFRLAIADSVIRAAVPAAGIVAGGIMSTLQIGSYVTHNKLQDLGSGEILSLEKGTVRIRFASGDRSFLGHLVESYLVTALEGPVMLAQKAAKRAKAKAAKKK
jgi:hypothetical protein